MLTFREDQIEVLKNSALAKFKTEMVEHCRVFSPKLSKILGDDQIRFIVSNCIDKAHQYGFSQRGPVRFYIDLCFLFGSGFDIDPQYPWASTILKRNSKKIQMHSATQLHEWVSNYMDNVSGVKQINTWQALGEIKKSIHTPLEISDEHFVQDVLKKLKHIHPAKAKFIGDKPAQNLIEYARKKCSELEFKSQRSQCLVTILMFVFGQSCIRDPLYPWIERTLYDTNSIDPELRAVRLESRSLIWLNQVLASENQLSEAQA